MSSYHPYILRCDVSGRPYKWLHPHEAILLYAREQVAWEYGENSIKFYGGTRRATGRRSFIKVSTIIAVHGDYLEKPGFDREPPLTNKALFERDGHMCMYCGAMESRHVSMTRDHIIPISRAGEDTWLNSVGACFRCNNRKADKTPWEAGMELLAVPYVPNHAEYLALVGRRMLADQMSFLKQQFPKESPLHKRM